MTILSEKPLDYSGQVWRGIDDKFPKKIKNATTTSDGLMSAEDKAKLDSINIDDYQNIYDIASWESDGLLSKDDKKKLDGIEENANNYIHPDTPEIRHVTDEQITYWNAKASTAVATQEINGLMSSADKKKLDDIYPYIEQTIKDHEEFLGTKHVTVEQIEYWDNKAEKDIATWNSDGLMSYQDKRKLDGIEENANNYIHPNNEGIRHVSDAEKEYWNSKADKTRVTNAEDGLMSYIDKIKLDGIEESANNYIHPDDENTRHVTDKQIAFWNSKTSTTIATPESDGIMSAEDKTKLDNIEPHANRYVHPDTHDATMIIEDETHRFVTDEEKEKWNNVVLDPATPESDGIMSAEDKGKLDQISLPQTNEASLILSEWTNEEPYTQTIVIPGISPDLNVYIGLNINATIEEFKIAAEAQLKVLNVKQDTITIIANGIKPDRDLPIIVMTGHNILVIENKHYHHREEYVYEAPTEGIHYQNEIVYSYTPVQSDCIGWVCIESGTPGVWAKFGVIDN